MASVADLKKKLAEAAGASPDAPVVADAPAVSPALAKADALAKEFHALVDELGVSRETTIATQMLGEAFAWLKRHVDLRA